MDTQIPDIALFTVLKAMTVIFVGAMVAQFGALMVKKKFYNGEKHDRRADSEQSRGWIERFLANQRECTESQLAVRDEMHKMLEALNKNGEYIREFTDKTQCKYDRHGGHKA